MNENTPTEKPLVKIGELAKASGVNVSTLKFYVKEGLLRPVLKTGRNMSWYDPDAVQTIQAIRTLQREHFYPLSVIKRLLNASTGDSRMDFALLDAIHKVDEEAVTETVGLAEAARYANLSSVQVRRLFNEGLIGKKKTGHNIVFSSDDLQLCALIRMRMDAGISFEQSIFAFSTYATALEKAAREDIEAFIRDAVLSPDFTATTGTEKIHVSDETLDRFIVLKRKAYNRAFGSQYVELLYRFSDALLHAITEISYVIEKMDLNEEARLLALATQGEPTGLLDLDECIRFYRTTVTDNGDGDIARSIAGAVRCRDYLVSLDANDTGAPLVAHILRLSWLRLVPDILVSDELAHRAELDLQTYLNRNRPDKAEALIRKIMEVLTHRGGSL